MEPKDPIYHSVMTIAGRDITELQEEWTVQQALEDIRSRQLGDRIMYFYVVDANRRLVGVIPTRRLLTAPLQERLSEIMIRDVITIPHTATVFDACELFAIHRFLALPVVNDKQQIVGVVDVGMFTDEILSVAERERIAEVFEIIGFRVSQLRNASPIQAFRVRFPWLTATIASGTICALLVGVYELTLAKTLVLAFFLTLVLGLGESVSMQSMTVTIQALRSMRPTLRWYLSSLVREAGTSLLLGAACGLAVGMIVWLWRGAGLPALVIGGSILLSLSTACFLGLSIPALLHALKLDPKVAAGPITLALADIFTVLIYFTLASFLL
ncbi:MAG: magnesium transporter [Anaerohalosphaeraceae bacterium]